MNATLQVNVPHIVHVQIDGFFAAVEQALRPRLRGTPVLVGGNMVISASHEAKLLGIVPGMAVERALAVCPTAAVVPARHERYEEFAERLRTILEGFTPAVDADSSHGFHLNFFGSPYLQGDFVGTLRRMQLEVLKLTGLGASLGAAKSKIAAAVASGVEPPGGLRVINRDTDAAFLASLPAAVGVDALCAATGLAPAALRERGIFSLGELRRVPRPSLISAFGDELGRKIWRHSRGLDVRLRHQHAGDGLLSLWQNLRRELGYSFLRVRALPETSG